MKWVKVGSQKYEAVSVTGRVYAACKLSLYLWWLTVDGQHKARSAKLKHLKDRAEAMDAEHQKQLLN